MSTATRSKERDQIYNEVDRECAAHYAFKEKQKITDYQVYANTFIKYIFTVSNMSLARPFEYLIFRKAMLRVAALAVAAVEWADRREEKEGNFRSY